ncbi:DMT family transporter [Lactiplantibacillus modestisalitolerans]|uniref:DMT family transporter n=1 Tax=Lactiplantibacillus modestisalitolerans TaxID=1457219 RepID=A0ABV5WS14_9LACO|nr:DMT family transporter [Lactiplantibacillus modestisalitolerans]
MGWLLLGIVIGIGLPVQTGVNTRLRDQLGTWRASCTSFAIGSGCLLVGWGVTAPMVRPVAWAQLACQPGWLWLGGLLGVAYLTGNLLLFLRLGAVQTVLFPIAGQVLMGLLIDQFGWFQAARVPLTGWRVAGALLVMAGITLTVITPQSPRVTTQPRAWGWQLLGILLGMLSASQTAINGRLGLVLHSAVAAALISFLVGTAALALIVGLARTSTPVHHPVTPWWAWTGGFLGALYVLGNVSLMQRLGTGLTVMIVLVGLVTGSLLIDQLGWLGAPKRAVTSRQLVGLSLMLIGVAAIRLIG